ncbi:MAG TPA: hypothetical protein VG346_05710 [Acidimicrobiales bacterium]|jgi:hypothetical protein|nr:hypothetical protein [Acidimicrobiales bacterium]
MQNADPLHDTVDRPLSWEDDVLGLDTIDQAETAAADADAASTSTLPATHANPMARCESARRPVCKDFRL